MTEDKCTEHSALQGPAVAANSILLTQILISYLKINRMTQKINITICENNNIDIPSIEKHVAMLDKATASFAFTSGMAALSQVVRLANGGEILCGRKEFWVDGDSSVDPSLSIREQMSMQ